MSRRGMIPLAPSLDTAGPMAWTAEDCALLLDAIAGYDPGDPGSVPGPKLSYARAISVPVKGLRVGLLRHFYERDVPAEPEVLRMMAQVIAVLKGLGCRVEDATLPPVQDYNAVGRSSSRRKLMLCTSRLCEPAFRISRACSGCAFSEAV